MKNLRKTVQLIAATSLALGGAFATLIACSSDDSVTTPTDGGNEATPGDGTLTDVPTPPPQDGGKDVVVFEAGTLNDFVTQEGEAACTRLKECCTTGSDAGDAGFDTAKCKVDFAKVGWDQSLNDVTKPGVLDGGHLVFDQAVATDCLTAMRNLSCSKLTAVEYKNIWQKCYDAVKGNVAQSGACKASVECVPTAFCDPDGGSCQPFLATNTACGGVDPSSAQCSYRGVGASQCLDDGDGGSKCQPGLANGKDCFFDFDCQSGSCNVQDDAGTIYKCDTSAEYLSFTCPAYLQ